MKKIDNPKIEGVEWMTKEDMDALIDATAQRYLGISGKEFIKRDNRGDYKTLDCGCGENSAVTRLRMLVPQRKPKKEKRKRWGLF